MGPIVIANSSRIFLSRGILRLTRFTTRMAFRGGSWALPKLHKYLLNINTHYVFLGFKSLKFGSPDGNNERL